MTCFGLSLKCKFKGSRHEFGRFDGYNRFNGFLKYDGFSGFIYIKWMIYISVDDIYQINSNIFTYQIDPKHHLDFRDFLSVVLSLHFGLGGHTNISLSK